MVERATTTTAAGREPCQNDGLEECSERYPRLLYYLHRARDMGLRGLLRRTLAAVGVGRRREAAPAAPCAADEATAPPERVLGLVAGDLVEVRSEEEILATLDEKGKAGGLLLMPEMLEHCGRRYRVHRRVERMILEGTGEQRRVRNTVLLADCYCEGWHGVCDRSCFYFWRESWLRRVEPEG